MAYLAHRLSGSISRILYETTLSKKRPGTFSFPDASSSGSWQITCSGSAMDGTLHTIGFALAMAGLRSSSFNCSVVIPMFELSSLEFL